MFKRNRELAAKPLVALAVRGCALATVVLAALPSTPEAFAAPLRSIAEEAEEVLTDEGGNAVADDVYEEEEDLNGEFVEAELTGSDTDEVPPEAEYPYPGAKEEGFAEQRPGQQPQRELVHERPKKIDDEGHYFYDTAVAEPTFSGRAGTPAPKKTTKAGEFHYDTHTETKFSGRESVEAPIQITEQGEFYYTTEQSPQNRSASLRLGFIQPPDIRNRDSGVLFQEVYSKNQLPVLLGDYEWRLTSSIGRLGIKFGSGLMTAQGRGQFRSADPSRRPDDIPEERYTFLLLPNQLTAIYRFQYADEQVIVPFVEGGAGYFTFMELRDDNASPKFGGAAATVAAGGANILLDWLDRKAIRNLDSDYGVNHVWLTMEYRMIIGLNKTYDFTSGVINAGVLFDF